ncbi:hypothetical protein M569_05238 [Genlisea aurea]|uniref:Uncharacterized protein n=1 Tax=Genlisea aurea TaxID=192259 RepID=S8E1J7_9LAMI|nr:hypothetical protein M569_05238 [Genlisea aurea]
MQPKNIVFHEDEEKHQDIFSQENEVKEKHTDDVLKKEEYDIKQESGGLEDVVSLVNEHLEESSQASESIEGNVSHKEQNTNREEEARDLIPSSYDEHITTESHTVPQEKNEEEVSIQEPEESESAQEHEKHEYESTTIAQNILAGEIIHKEETEDAGLPREQIKEEDIEKENQDQSPIVQDGIIENFREVSLKQEQDTINEEIGEKRNDEIEKNFTEDEEKNQLLSSKDKVHDVEQPIEGVFKKDATENEENVQDIEEVNEIKQVSEGPDQAGSGVTENIKESTQISDETYAELPQKEERETTENIATDTEEVHDYGYTTTISEETKEKNERIADEAYTYRSSSDEHDIIQEPAQFGTAHEPEKHDFESIAQAQSLLEVEETETKKKLGAAAEVETGDTSTESTSKSDEITHGKETVQTETSTEKITEKVIEKEDSREEILEIPKNDDTEEIKKDEEPVGDTQLDSSKTERSTDSNVDEVVNKVEIRTREAAEHTKTTNDSEKVFKANEDAKEHQLDYPEEEPIYERTVEDPLQKENVEKTEENIEIKGSGNIEQEQEADENIIGHLQQSIGASEIIGENEQQIKSVETSEKNITELNSEADVSDHEVIKTASQDSTEEAEKVYEDVKSHTEYDVEKEEEANKQESTYAPETETQEHESIVQAESHSILEAGKVEENLDAAPETKKEKIISEVILQPDDSNYEKETEEVKISSEKIEKEVGEGETYANFSEKDEVIEIHPEAEANKEAVISTGEKLRGIENAEETQVADSPDVVDGKVIQQLTDTSEEPEKSDRSIHQVDIGESIGKITSQAYGQETHESYPAYVNTERDESIKKIVEENEATKDLDKDEVKVIASNTVYQENETNAEESLDATIYTNETEKDFESLEEDEKEALEKPKEILETTKPFDGSVHDKEQAESIEPITPAIDGEKAQDLNVTTTENKSADSLEKQIEKEVDKNDHLGSSEEGKITEPHEEDEAIEVTNKTQQLSGVLEEATTSTDESTPEKEHVRIPEISVAESKELDSNFTEQLKGISSPIKSIHESIEHKEQITALGSEEDYSFNLESAKRENKVLIEQAEEEKDGKKEYYLGSQNEATVQDSHLEDKDIGGEAGPAVITNAKEISVPIDGSIPQKYGESTETVPNVLDSEETSGLDKEAHAQTESEDIVEKASKPDDDGEDHPLGSLEKDTILVSHPEDGAEKNTETKTEEEVQVEVTKDADDGIKVTNRDSGETRRDAETTIEAAENSSVGQEAARTNSQQQSDATSEGKVKADTSKSLQEGFDESSSQDEYVILESVQTKSINTEDSKVLETKPSGLKEVNTAASEDISDPEHIDQQQSAQQETIEDLHAEKAYEHIKADEEQHFTEEAEDADADADAKSSHKKQSHHHHHNLLSGVGSKVKHSLDKVKKAITGKSSQKSPK